MAYVIASVAVLEAVLLIVFVRFYFDVWTHNTILKAREKDVEDLKEAIKVMTEVHSDAEAKLREQVQHLAERLSTLRIERGARPEQDRFEPDPEVPEPYSQQLQDFLLAIEYEDARQLVEEDIERLRQEDLSDEQIHDILSQGK